MFTPLTAGGLAIILPVSTARIGKVILSAGVHSGADRLGGIILGAGISALWVNMGELPDTCLFSSGHKVR